MHWLKLKRHKGVSSAQAECWLNVDNFLSIEPFKHDGSVITFVGGHKDCFFGTPQELIDAIKKLIDDVRTTE